MTDPATLDPEVLLRHRGFVRGLALDLLRDEDDADDVCQEAWAAALQRPPARPERLRAWLGQVVRRLSLNLLRERGRRRRREERYAPAEATPSTAEIVHRIGVEQEVVRAVTALAEPARTAILLRYYEGLPPRRIARRLGVPVETVRARIRRGRERLRRDLDAFHDGDRAAWGLLLLPAPVWGVGAMGMGMGAKVGIAAAAGVLVLATWTAWPDPRGDSGPGHSDGTSAVVAESSPDVVTRAEPTRDVAVGPIADREAVERKYQELFLEGRIVGIEPGIPWTTPLTIRSATGQSIAVNTPVKSVGSFRADLSRLVAVSNPPSSFTVQANEPLYAVSDGSVRIAPDGTLPFLELHAMPVARLHGRVVDAAGAPAPGLRIAIFHAADGIPTRPIIEEQTDEEGRFEAALDVDGPICAVAWGGNTLTTSSLTGQPVVIEGKGLLPARSSASLVRGVDVELPDLRLGLGLSLSGTVRNHAGIGIPDALVVAVPDRFFSTAVAQFRTCGGEVLCTEEDIFPSRLHAVTDAFGGYRIDGLTPGVWSVGLQQIGDCAVTPPLIEESGRRVVVPAQNVDLSIVASVVQIEVWQDGKPLRSASAELWDTAEGGGWVLNAASGAGAGTETIGLWIEPSDTHVLLLHGKGSARNIPIHVPFAGAAIRLTVELDDETGSR